MPERNAIALVFSDADGRVLTVKRSGAKDPLPNFWSLPSTWIYEKETPQSAANRLAKDKLGYRNVVLAPKPLGISRAQREDYILVMNDYKVEEAVGVLSLNPNEYTELRWVTPHELKELFDREHNGAMGECARTFLRAQGIK